MGKSIVIILLCVSVSMLNAQDSLCVYKMKFGALVNDNGTKRPLNKGDYLSESSTLYITQPSDILLINDSGEAFKIKKTGTYTYKRMLAFKALDNQKSLTSKYLKLIWDELVKKASGETIIGGVYRGDILMKFPRDSVQTASTKLIFNWKPQNEESNYFIFIRNIETDEIFKFSTNGTSLILYKDNPVFNAGNQYEWSVSTEEFPNLKNILFYSFTLIQRLEYKALKERFSEVISDLKTLGFTDSEIEESICETYGVCK